MAYNWSYYPYLSSDNYTTLDVDLALAVETQVCLALLYGVTTILAVAGNVLVLLVATWGHLARSECAIYLKNLAVADILMATFCIPFSFTELVWSRWLFYPWFCPITLSAQVLTVSASVYTLLVISIDRWHAIKWPLQSRATAKYRRLVVGIIWTAAMLTSATEWIVGRAVPFTIGPVEYLKCMETWESSSRRVYSITLLTLTYILPLLVQAVAYSQVALVFVRRARSRQWAAGADSTAGGIGLSSQSLDQTRNTVLRILVITVVVFAICWLPHHALTLILDFNPQLIFYETEEEEVRILSLYITAHWLAMANPCLNPFIYTFVSRRFLGEAQEILRLGCRSSNNPFRFSTSARPHYYSPAVTRHHSLSCAPNTSSMTTNSYSPQYQLTNGRRLTLSQTANHLEMKPLRSSTMPLLHL